MSDRITQRDLEATCRRINRVANGTDQHEPWERIDGKLSQVPDVFTISYAYGGASLHRNCSVDGNGESHGVHDVLSCGHVPKRELYNRMHAFLDGLCAGIRVAS